MESVEQTYWTTRYQEKNTGWDIGSPSTPLRKYIDQLRDKEMKILIPGAGNAYEAEYLYNKGFKNVFVLDISELPLKALKERLPDFPDSQLIHGDFFEHTETYDRILEQTFFCAIEPTPESRTKYATKMSELLNTDGKLIGLWFNHPLEEGGKRPYGGSKVEYLSYIRPLFDIRSFEACYNSIEPRMGKELFGLFQKKQLSKRR